MVTTAEVKSLLESLPKDLNNCAFLSDAYATLRAYNGEEMSKEVVYTINLIKSFINKEINAIDDTQTLTPEEAVVINDYLSIYKEDELSSKQKSVRDGLKPLLDKYDQENDLDKINQDTDVSGRLDTWNDIANSVQIFSYGRDNEISIAEQYREFEKFLGLLKSKDAEELVDVLKVNTTQELSKKAFPLSNSMEGYKGYYAGALKNNLERAEAQIALTYLILEKADKKEKDNIKNGKVDLASAKIKYSITDADIKNFDFSAVDKDRLTLAVNITSCVNASNSNIVALRIKQKTNAPSVWYKIKQLDKQLSKRHPKLYSVANNFVKMGQKTAMRSALVGTLGVKGLAIYAGIEIGSAVYKNYKMFEKEKAKAQQAGKSYYKNYLQYITAKNNRKALISMTSTAAIAATTAYFGAFADAAKAVAKPLAVGAISVATSIALIPEKRRARQELKEFLLSAGIKEKDISEKKLRLSPKKYSEELLIINGIVLNSKQEQEFEKKLNNLIQIRREQAARVGGAAVGAAVGLGINSGIVNSGGLSHFMNKIGTRGGSSGEMAEDVSTSANDTLQENNYTSIDKDSLMSDENTSTNAPVDNQTQEISEQKTTVKTTHHKNTASVSHANQSNNVVDEQTSQQSQNLQQEQEVQDNTSQSPIDPNSALYSVMQPEDNVFITNDGVIVELVDQDSQINMVYSDNVSEYSEEEFAAIDRNIYNAISEKDNPTNTEIRFADEYAKANNLSNAEQITTPQTGLSPEDEELLKKLGVSGKNVTIEHTIDENGNVHTRVIQRNVAPSNEPSNAASNEPPMQERIEQQRERISARQQEIYADNQEPEEERIYSYSQEGKYIPPSRPPHTPQPSGSRYIPPSLPPDTPPASGSQYIPPSVPPITPQPGEHFFPFGWFHHEPQSMPPHTPPASGSQYIPPSHPPYTPQPGEGYAPSQPPVTPQPGGNGGNAHPNNGGGGNTYFGHRGRGNGGR